MYSAPGGGLAPQGGRQKAEGDEGSKKGRGQWVLPLTALYVVNTCREHLLRAGQSL